MASVTFVTFAQMAVEVVCARMPQVCRTVVCEMAFEGSLATLEWTESSSRGKEREGEARENERQNERDDEWGNDKVRCTTLLNRLRRWRTRRS